MPALRTELGVIGHWRATVAAGTRERQAALLAKFGERATLVLTARTPHADSREEPGTPAYRTPRAGVKVQTFS